MRVFAISPATASMAAPPGFSRSRASIASELSMPTTGTPRPRGVGARAGPPALGQRPRDPAGADRELERAPAGRELGEGLHRRPDDLRGVHAPGVVVIPRGDALAEVPSVPCP